MTRSWNTYAISGDFQPVSSPDTRKPIIKISLAQQEIDSVDTWLSLFLFDDPMGKRAVRTSVRKISIIGGWIFATRSKQ